jgi:hypothetical protein
MTGEISGFAAVPHGAIHPGGVAPEALWSFAKTAGYEIDIMWSAAGGPGVYDVVFRRGAMRQARASRPRLAPMPWDAYASVPTRAGLRSALISEWRQYLQQTLPERMMPANFTVVELLPRNAGGELSRRVLRSPVPTHRQKENVTAPGAMWF